MRAVRMVCILTMSVVPSSGCSFIASRVPQNPVPVDEPCSSRAPYLDAAVAISSPIPFLLVNAPCASDGQEGCSPGQELGNLFFSYPALVVGLVATASMVYGLAVDYECREARQQRRDAELRDRAIGVTWEPRT